MEGLLGLRGRCSPLVGRDPPRDLGGRKGSAFTTGRVMSVTIKMILLILSCRNEFYDKTQHYALSPYVMADDYAEDLSRCDNLTELLWIYMSLK